MDIQGSVVVVVGGGSGLGAATARRLASGGATVVVADRDEAKAKAVAAELGGENVGVGADVTKTETLEAAFAAASARGTVRAVVNTAGIGWAQRTTGRDGSPHDLDSFRLVVEINLIGTFNVLRLGAAAMQANEPAASGERGVVVNTASVAAFDGQIGQAAYAASKAGVVGLTLPVARDLSKAGIRVVTIAPGLFDTPLLAMLPEPARKALEANIPFPSRLGDPAEFASLAASIIENSYLNGETIRLDASLRMQPK